jgi:hypothetical protein
MLARFPEEERMQWHAIDQAAVTKTTDFESGKDSVTQMLKIYSVLIQN